MKHLAESYQAAHQLEKSLSLYEQTFELRKTKFGADHPDTLRSMDDLLSAYASIGEVAKFDTLFPLAIEQWRKSFPENSPQLATVLAKCGRYLLALQRAEDAESLLRECLSIRQAKQANAWNTFNTHSVLGGALLAQYATLVDEIERADRLAEAEPLLVAGYEGMKDREATVPRDAASYVLPALDRLIQLYTLLDRQNEVKQYNDFRAAYLKAEDAKK